MAAALAGAHAFGLELGETADVLVRRVEEAELAEVADLLQSAFVFPLQTSGPLHLGTALGQSVGQWEVPAGSHWAGLYEVFPDCEETIGAQYVLVLAAEDELPTQRWSTLPHLTDIDRTPEKTTIPSALELPGDGLDDGPLPDLRELFGGGGASKSEKAPSASEEKASATIASRLFAAMAELGDDEGGDDDDNDDGQDDASGSPAAAREDPDPFVRLMKQLVAEEQLELVPGASARKLAGSLELALERDPMVFQRPGEWFVEQDEVGELFASDEDLNARIVKALER